MILIRKFTTLNFLLFRFIHAYFCLRNFDFYFCKSVVASIKSQSLKTVVKSYKQWGNT